MIIRVKEKESEEEKEKDRKGRTSERKRTKRKAKALRSSLLDHDSSVEVGYGLCYFIVNSKWRLICIGWYCKVFYILDCVVLCCDCVIVAD